MKKLVEDRHMPASRAEGPGGLRLATIGLKAAYIAAAVIVVVVVAVVVGRSINPTAKSIVLDAVIVIVWVIGIRSFRGSNEDLLARRAWWRATARPLLGYLVAGVLLVLAVLALVGLAMGRSSLTNLVIENVAGLPVYILGAITYLNSSLRLTMSGRAERSG